MPLNRWWILSGGEGNLLEDFGGLHVYHKNTWLFACLIALTEASCHNKIIALYDFEPLHGVAWQAQLLLVIESSAERWPLYLPN